MTTKTNGSFQAQINHRRLAASLYCALLSTTAYSQTYTQNYEFPNDQKQYSTEIVTGTQHESVMAGTIYRSVADGGNIIHFLHLDAAGNIAATEYYDDPDYIDERAVDIVPAHIGGQDLYIITCLVRPDANAPVSVSDRIKLIVVDVNGAVQSTKLFYETQSRGLYPMHTIMHNNSLFICGFQTEQRYISPADPSPSTYGDRKGFVIKIDPNNLTVLNSLTFDYVYSNSPAIQIPAWASALYDFDMPVRMIPLRDDPTKIFITGSVNDVCYEGFGPLVQVQQMSTMSIVIDQNLNVIYDKPFGKDTDTYTNGEFGVGLYQDISVTPTRNYIVCNASDPRADGLSSHNFMITYVNQNFDYATGPGTAPRVHYYSFDGAKALSTFNVYTGGSRDGSNFGIAGIQEYHPAGCFPPAIAPDYKNTNPFLVDLTLMIGSGPTLFGTVNNWVTYMNQTGTGNSLLDPNSYDNLGSNGYLNGGVLANVGKNPTFAARNSINDDFILSAPKWNAAGNSLLNLKALRAKFDDFTVPGCSGSYQQFIAPDPCAGKFHNWLIGVAGLGIPTVNDVTPSYGTLNITDANTNTTAGNYKEDRVVDCNDAGGPHFKYATQLPDVNVVAGISLHPNPATDVLVVKGADNRPYSISDMTGRTLSRGTLAGQEIDLRMLAAGTYLIHIHNENNSTVHLKFIKD